MNAETRERLRQAVSDRRRELVKPPSNPASIAKRQRVKLGRSVVATHSRNGYYRGCRCEVCTEANRVYARDYSRQRRAAS